MSESMNLLSDVKKERTSEGPQLFEPQYKGPEFLSDQKTLETTSYIPDLDLYFQEEVSKNAMTAFRKARWSEDSKKDFFGPLFVDFFDLMPLDQREKAVAAVSRYNSSESRFKDEMTMFAERIRGGDERVEKFRTDVLAKLEARKNNLFVDQKSSSLSTCAGHPDMTEGQIQMLVDLMNGLSGTFDAYVMIFDRLGDILEEDITEQEKNDVLSQLPKMVSDYHDTESVQTYLGYLKTSKSDEVVSKTNEEQISSEQEKIALLESEKASLIAEHIPERSEEVIRTRFEGATLTEYVPKSALGKITSFKDFRSEKVEGVSKTKAFFDKKKLRGKELQTRMEKHVRRFLSARNGVSEDGIARVSDVLVSSSGILANTKALRALEGKLKDRFELIGVLSEMHEGTAIRDVLIRTKAFLAGTPVSDGEVPLNSDFFNAHLKAAKVVALHKLLEQIGAGELATASEEMKGRIEALRSNISLLYNAVISSQEYKNEVKRQRLTRIERSIAAHNNRIALLMERDALKNEAAERTEEMVTGIRNLVKEEKDAVWEAQHRALEQQERAYAEKVQEAMAAARKSREERIRLISENIAKSREKNLGDRNVAVIEDLMKDKADNKEMDQGAEAYLKTIITSEYVSQFDPKWHEFIAESALISARRLCIGMGKDITKCNVDEIKRLGMYFGKCLENEAFKAGIQELSTVDDTTYRIYLFKSVFSGEKIMSRSEFAAQISEVTEMADGYLSHCKSYKGDTGQVVLRIADLEKSTARDKHLRATARLYRMQNLKESVRACLGDDNTPMSVYEFFREKGWMIQKLVRVGKKNPAVYETVQKNVSELSNEKLKEEYEHYLDAFFASVTMNGKLSFDGEEYPNKDAVKALIKDRYSEYGATVGIQKVIENLDDIFNHAGNEVYQRALVQEEMKAAREEEKRLEAASLTEGDTEKIGKIDKRLQGLKENRGSRFTRIIDVIVDNPLFRVNLFNSSDEQFAHYASELTQLCDDVVKEMSGHVFVDQYLVEKKKEIIDYVIYRSGKALNEALELNELDARINRTQVEETVDGKLKFIPFADYVKKAIGGYGEATEENALLGSVAVEILTEYGGSALMTTKFDENSDRVLGNLKALDSAIDKLDIKGDAETLELKRETIRKSLHQIERDNMMRLPFTEFIHDLEHRLIEDMNRIYEEKEAVDLTSMEMKKTGMAIQKINTRKEAGEQAIKGFVQKADELYRDAIAAKTETSTDMTSTEVTDTTADAESLEAIKKQFKDLTDKASEFTSDPFLEPFYVSTLKMMTGYALGGDKENVERTVYSLYKMQTLSIAADHYIDETYKQGEFSSDQRMLFKRGLFRYYGERLVPRVHEGSNEPRAEQGEPAEKTERTGEHKHHHKEHKHSGHVHSFTTVESCEKMIKKLLSADKSINGVGMLNFITDGSLMKVNSEQAVGETAIQTDARKEFEESLKELFKKNKLTLPEGPEEKVLFEYLLLKRTDESVVKDIAALMAEKGNLESLNERSGGVIMSYISGESIAQSTQTIDYTKLRDYAVSHPEVLREELERVRTLKETKEERMRIPEVFVEADEKTLISSMNYIRAVTDKYKKELASDILMSGREKLWRFYTVARSYSGTLDMYRQHMINRTKTEPTHRVYDDLQETYALLQAFFAPGMEDESVMLKVYGLSLCGELGIYPEISNPALRLEAERKWEKAQEGLTGYLSEATGEEAVEHSTELLDREEREYDAEVVERVKTVDRWLIEYTGNWGNSESGHVLEIMSRPLRERLFIYYTIEHDMEESSEGLDAAMAINVYTPDVKAIEANLKRRTKLIRNAGASIIKMIPGVKGKGYVDSYGLVKSAKVEGVMRRLDYDQADVGEKLKKMSEEKIFADRVARKAKETNDDLLNTIVTRDACYRQLLKEIEVQRDLLKKHGAKAADAQECKDQIVKIADVAGQLKAADGKVGRYYEKLHITKKADEVPKVEEIKARETKETEFGDRNETVGDYIGMVSDLAETINPYDEDSEEYSYCLPWNLEEPLAELLDNVSGICSGLSSITSFIGAVISIKETVEDRKKLSASGKADAIADNVSDVNDFIENFADFLSYVAPATEETASAVAGVAGAVIGIGTGLVKWVTAGVKYAGVLDAQEKAVETAEALSQKQGGETEKTANNIDLKGAVEKVAALQTRITRAECINGELDFVNGVFGVLSIAAPALAPVFATFQGAVEIVKAIHTFWANKDQRESTVDEYIDMDKLFEKYTEVTAGVSESDKMRLGEDSDTIKTNLRRMALRHMHFSTMEEFFSEITNQYATLLYGQIFFDNGEPILAGDTDKIAERAALFELFPGLKFTYPATKEEKPELTIEDLAENLSREA